MQPFPFVLSMSSSFFWIMVMVWGCGADKKALGEETGAFTQRGLPTASALVPPTGVPK